MVRELAETLHVTPSVLYTVALAGLLIAALVVGFVLASFRSYSGRGLSPRVRLLSRRLVNRLDLRGAQSPIEDADIAAETLEVVELPPRHQALGQCASRRASRSRRPSAWQELPSSLQT